MKIRRWVSGLLVAVLLMFLVLLPGLRRESANLPLEGPHFVMIAPSRESETLDIEELTAAIARDYEIALELHRFPTLAEQKRMLRVLAETDVDGVLLWPITVNELDFEAELKELKHAGIPVVIIERDVAASLRSSYIGSGFNSNFLVLNQTLKTLEKNDSFVVGNLSGSGAAQSAELLFFKQMTDERILEDIPRDTLLVQLAQHPPEGYQPVELMRFEGQDALSVYLKYKLIHILSQPDCPDLLFSLDGTLSGTAIAARNSSALPKQSNSTYLLCYGEADQYLEELENGDVDALVTSRPDVSIFIGLRYLRDIHRGYWVPEIMDSGILLRDSTRGTDNE